MKGAGKAVHGERRENPRDNAASFHYLPDSFPTHLGLGDPKELRCIRVIVTLPTGLNLRASSVIAATASEFPCHISIRNEMMVVDAKGILSVMSLGADTGTPLEITAKGPGANRSLDILAGLTTLEGQSFFSLVDRG